MLNFEMFINTKWSDKVQLVYREDAFELKKKWTFEFFGDPRYQYLWSADWEDWDDDESYKKSTWVCNLHIVMVGKKPAGYIKWIVNRSHNNVEEHGMMLLPKYHKSEIGMVAMKKWADHVLLERKFRKIVIGSFPDNKEMHACVLEAQKIGLRHVGTYIKHKKLLDGEYHDMSKFELLREDYIEALAAAGVPTGYFHTTVKKSKTKSKKRKSKKRKK